MKKKKLLELEFSMELEWVAVAKLLFVNVDLFSIGNMVNQTSIVSYYDNLDLRNLFCAKAHSMKVIKCLINYISREVL